MDLVRIVEERIFSDFHLIPAKGSTPNLQSIPAVAATWHFSRSWDAVHRAAISYLF